MRKLTVGSTCTEIAGENLFEPYKKGMQPANFWHKRKKFRAH